jgi:spore coat polysaccharide biosynthesis protein SpsF
VTTVFYEHPETFNLILIPMPESLRHPGIRLTLDTPEDLEILRKLFAKMPVNFHINDVYRILQEHPILLKKMSEQIERHPK